jgi:hypothetical protein
MQAEFSRVDRIGQGAFSSFTREITNLERRIPIVGNTLSGVTRELLRMGDAKKPVDELGNAFNRFRTVLGEIATGRNAGAAGELRNLGVSLQQALRNPEAAFQTFIGGLRGMQTQAGQTALAVNVLGANVGTKLLPALEGATAETASTGWRVHT